MCDETDGVSHLLRGRGTQGASTGGDGLGRVSSTGCAECTRAYAAGRVRARAHIDRVHAGLTDWAGRVASE
ncbi:hypothetical protein [Streptomyces sp. NPDC012466]|uniref:hypothetical protein n=1 Tax=Streptomyces sp. NPDC012466 TaxID=3364835 RepID=UPI0036E0C39D